MIRALAQFFIILLVVGFIAAYIWPIAISIAIIVVLWLIWLVAMNHADLVEERRAAEALITARADQQHAWVLAGDPRGIYGGDQASGIQRHYRALTESVSTVEEVQKELTSIEVLIERQLEVMEEL